MTAPRRLTAALIALGILSLSGGVTPPSGDIASSIDPFSYAAFESSEDAYTAATALSGLHTGLLPVEITRLSVAIAAESSRANLPIELVLALIQVESSGNNFAVSPVGAMGLMQLMPATAASLGVTQPFRVNHNISGGARYLRMMHDRFGNWPHALAAYNAGPQAVVQYRGIPPFRETRQYVRRVLNYYRRYDADFRP